MTKNLANKWRRAINFHRFHLIKSKKTTPFKGRLAEVYRNFWKKSNFIVNST